MQRVDKTHTWRTRFFFTHNAELSVQWLICWLTSHGVKLSGYYLNSTNGPLCDVTASAHGAHACSNWVRVHNSMYSHRSLIWSWWQSPFNLHPVLFFACCFFPFYSSLSYSSLFIFKLFILKVGPRLHSREISPWCFTGLLRSLMISERFMIHLGYEVVLWVIRTCTGIYIVKTMWPVPPHICIRATEPGLPAGTICTQLNGSFMAIALFDLIQRNEAHLKTQHILL